MGAALNPGGIMAETVWKYPFDFAGSFTLELPLGADVLHAADQGGQPCLWARVNLGQPTESRRFHVVGTGHPIPVPGKDQLIDHVATFPMGAFVWHLFEVY